MIRTVTFVAALLAAPMAFADSHDIAPSGDPEAGEDAFRACVSCHVVDNEAGERLAGRNGRAGPNLYAINGRTAGSLEGFRYSPSMTALGETGLVWSEADFVAFVQNSTAFLRETLGDSGARSAMSYRVRTEEDAADLFAYLTSLVPADATDDEEGEEGEEGEAAGDQ